MIKNIHRLAISSQEKLQQEQYDTEIDLKKSIVEKIKTAQLEVAEPCNRKMERKGKNEVYQQGNFYIKDKRQ